MYFFVRTPTEIRFCFGTLGFELEFALDFACCGVSKMPIDSGDVRKIFNLRFASDHNVHAFAELNEDHREIRSTEFSKICSKSGRNVRFPPGCLLVAQPIFSDIGDFRWDYIAGDSFSAAANDAGNGCRLIACLDRMSVICPTMLQVWWTISGILCDVTVIVKLSKSSNHSTWNLRQTVVLDSLLT